MPPAHPTKVDSSSSLVRTSEEVLELITRLHQTEQLTVILVTHDPDIAACAHRVVILHDGLVVHDQASSSRGGPPIPSIRSFATARGGT